MGSIRWVLGSVLGVVLLGGHLRAATKVVDVGPGDMLVFLDEESSTSTTTITAGDTVKWVWRSSGHSTTRDDSPEAWNSDIQDGPFSFAQRFSTPGTYAYHCIPHQIFGMVGTVVVLPATGTSTTLPPERSTTTSTSTSTSTTTTTVTLPPAITAQFDAIADRLDSLLSALSTTQVAGRRRAQLAQRIQVARQTARRARQLLTFGRRGAARASLRQAIRALAVFEVRVRILARHNRIGADVRILLLDGAEATRAAFRTLTQSVR